MVSFSYIPLDVVKYVILPLRSEMSIYDYNIIIKDLLTKSRYIKEQKIKLQYGKNIKCINIKYLFRSFFSFL